MISFVRVDDRLLHGQVIHAWVPFTGADMLVVVTESSSRAFIEKELTAIAGESGCEVAALTLGEAAAFLKDAALDERRVMVIFSSIGEAFRSYEMGLDFTALNIGNVHHTVYKKKLSSSAMITEDEERELEKMSASGVAIDVRAVPEPKAVHV
ncbi:MAG: PTS sugar transporter subunit IIB [Thermodesulfobacteriota bacterium]